MNHRLKKLPVILLPACMIYFTACNQPANKTSTTTMTDSTTRASLPPAKGFEKTVNGRQSHFYLLKNKNGVQAAISDYGAHLIGLLVPDKTGKLTDVALGFDDIDGYKKALSNYYGATIGRYGNRIAKGHFVLDGKRYDLFINNKPNTLHGGKVGFNDVMWDAKQADEHTITLTYLSKDMEEGYPGNLNCKVTYELTDDNAVKISYEATTDKNTIVNLTNHSYFNLNGVGNGTILNHVVQLKAGNFTPVDTTLIPTGKIVPVAGTPFDFSAPTAIGSRIEVKDDQLKNGKGYDHNFVLDKHDITTSIATVTGDLSGIKMEIFTTEPGLQFYSGNFMDGSNTLWGGKKDEHRTGFAMETQHFPDSPNQPQFPSTELKPGETYKTQTSYKFSVVK
ncbi:aldose epimerase family protein [Mucilaginibacter sp. OK098]|uniref:aldose epimerase family protein n=1 Tax=Mucilaginibacter sp. OK098 TaxID=1855297 RepID=UPI0009213B34|nr:aldose epimerase family protein [Mucilaginibacter sp. OK098]SHM16016.1 aldose 1-epimerase [Mucilaginibacter sp. OK098]